MGAVESIDYEAVLADLRDKRAKLDAAIAGIEQFLLGRPSSSAEAGAEAPSQARLPEQIESDSFFNLSTTEAIKKYLRMVKKPKPAKVIHDALLEGGFITTAKNFYSNVYTAMKRSRDFMNVGGGNWGLAEWYSGGRRVDAQPKTGGGVSGGNREGGQEKAAKREGKTEAKPNGADASPAASPAPATSAPEPPAERSHADVAN